MANKHIRENDAKIDEEIMNSIITSKDKDGNKNDRKEASVQMKKLRTKNIMQELEDKDEQDSIDWAKEHNEAQDSSVADADQNQDVIDAQEKEV